MKTSGGRVYLVGAGPGDPELITVRARKLLDVCDALVYDNLISDQLVDSCPAPIKHYVGKKSGAHSLPQAEINQLLYRLATFDDGPKIIVRLKGGDPGIFGRAAEEASYLAEKGVPVVIVPGVTSALAAAAEYGIPLTARGIAAGVTFITGHARDGKIPDIAWGALAELNHTLVIYMGVGAIAPIQEKFLAAGFDEKTPASIIENGSLPGSRAIFAELGELSATAAAENLVSPAVIIIGRVTEMAEKLAQPKPLKGKTVLLVHAAGRSYPELLRLKDAGAEVLTAAVIDTEPRFADPEVRRILDGIEERSLVGFTSALALKYFLELAAEGVGAVNCRFVAIGPAVIKELDLRCIEPFAEAPVTGPGAAVEALRAAGVAPGEKIYLPRAAIADTAAPQELEAAGFKPIQFALYDTISLPLPDSIAAALIEDRIDAVLLPSGSCAGSLVENIPELVGKKFERVRFAAIGKKTAIASAAHGLPCELVSQTPTLPALIDLVIDQQK